MNVLGICWMGVETERFNDMRQFLAALLGVEPAMREQGFAVWTLPSGDLVELFPQGQKPAFGTGPVVGFLVDDLDAARRVLEEAGAEIVGGWGPNERGYEAVHFRAPDGNVYEVVRDPAREAPVRAHRSA